MTPRTVRNFLRRHGFRSAKPLPKPLLREAHIKDRLRWARAHQDKGWERVVFSDETTFWVEGRVRRVWLRVGAHYVIRKVKYPLKVQVWGCMARSGFGRLCCFTGNMDAEKLCKIYEGTLIPSAAELLGDADVPWELQEDNDSKHRSKRAREWKEANGVHVLPWPSCSPDMNPIENVWALLKDRVGLRLPSTLRRLVRAIHDEWNALSSDLAARLVDSMPERLAAVLAANGDYTPY